MPAGPPSPNQLTSTLTRHTTYGRSRSPNNDDPASRRRVARWLQAAGDYLGNAAHDRFNLNAFNHSRARDFPEIPGEARRNPDLPRIRKDFHDRRELILREMQSRTGSPAASNVSVFSGSGEAEGGSPRVSVSSPGPQRPSLSSPGRPDSSPGPGRQRRRRDTLEVPVQAHHRT